MADIFSAIREGDIDAVERLLQSDPGAATARNAEGISPLMLAWYTFNPKMRALLREHAGDLDAFESAMVGDLARMMALFDADPSLVTAYSPDGFTPLHFAGFFNQPEIARVLIERGAPLDALTKNDLANMPLHAAAAGRANEVCRMLLEAGADPNARQHGGFTPLQEAAHHGNGDLVEMLLAHGADAALRNDEGHTAAKIAGDHGFAEIAARLGA